MSAPAQRQQRRPASAGGGAEEEAGRRGTVVEKRSHPAAAVPRGRHGHLSRGGNCCPGGAAASAEAMGSPVISHLSKGGRFSGKRERQTLRLFLKKFLGNFCALAHRIASVLLN